MTFFEEDWWRVIKNTREEWAGWRASSTPVLDAIHTVLEVLLIFGWLWRFFTHLMMHAAYLEDELGNTPEYTDADFRFTALVWPILEPVNWRQEALMRGTAALMGVMILSLGINPRVTLYSDMAMIQLKFWVALTNGGYLLFDPLLGVAQWIATR